jgi:hypothetical protein
MQQQSYVSPTNNSKNDNDEMSSVIMLHKASLNKTTNE